MAFYVQNVSENCARSQLAVRNPMTDKEIFAEIANRAANFMDPDAADWMPSIYKLACEAIGEDPWPLLTRNGYPRERLTVSIHGEEAENSSG